LQWLDQQPLGGKTVIDFGCGSGILGIAAVLLGARKVFAVDNDPQALLATRDNAERNAISASQIDCLLPSNLPEDLDGEFMLANILAAPLIQLAPQLSAMTQPGGQICLSGILATQIDAVCAPYNEHFQFDPPIISSGWAQLGAKKIPS
jgi:ribosomal protein L11 methyltransferase